MSRKPRKFKKQQVPLAHADSVLQLIPKNVPGFSLHEDTKIILEPARDGYGPRLHLFDRGREIIISLQPGTQVLDYPATILTPAQLRNLPRTAVVAIRVRPIKQETKMQAVPTLEYIKMTADETARLREIAADLIDATPRTEQPVITRAEMALRYFPTDPHSVVLEVGDSPHALKVLILEVPGWVPFRAGKWSSPPEIGAFGVYASVPVYRRAAAH